MKQDICRSAGRRQARQAVVEGVAEYTDELGQLALAPIYQRFIERWSPRRPPAGATFQRLLYAVFPLPFISRLRAKHIEIHSVYQLRHYWATLKIPPSGETTTASADSLKIATTAMTANASHHDGEQDATAAGFRQARRDYIYLSF